MSVPDLKTVVCKCRGNIKRIFARLHFGIGISSRSTADGERENKE
jgi:hypothetical protein